MKIIHIFGRLEKGGAELRTLEVIRSTLYSGFQHDVCVLSGLKGSLDQNITTLGGTIHYLPIYKFWFSLKFIKLLRKEKYDIVHSHIHHTSGYILFLAKIANIRGRIAHYRSTGKQTAESKLKNIQTSLKKQLLSKFATSILSVSINTMNYAWSENWKKDKRCKVIYNGINNNIVIDREKNRQLIINELSINIDSNIYIHVGRFDEPKNHKRCITIFQAVSTLDPKAILILVGKGNTPEEKYVIDFVSNNKLNNKVYFLGIRSDIPALLSSADILLFPSLWEGLPGVVLESYSVGTPVLASDIPPIVEVTSILPQIRHISLTRNDVEWAEKAINIINSHDNRQKKKMIDEFNNSLFTIEKASQQHYDVWKSYDDQN